MAYLVRGAHTYQVAWHIRGNNFINQVLPEHQKAFSRKAKAALSDIQKARSLDASNPYVWLLELKMLRDSGQTKKQNQLFKAAIKRFPHYYPLYSFMLISLQPKWGGSVGAMRDFVNQYAKTASADSELKLLYLTLYRQILSVVSYFCERKTDLVSTCVKLAKLPLKLDPIRKEVEQFIQQYPSMGEKWVNFLWQVTAQLRRMAKIDGVRDTTNELLQQLAEITHTDIALSSTNTATNKPAVDYAAAMLWYQKGHYQNAITLLERAADDLTHASDLSKIKKAYLLVRLYGAQASAYKHLGNSEKTVTYLMASNLIKGRPGTISSSAVLCDHLSNLHFDKKAAPICEARALYSGDYQALAFAGMAYEAMGQLRKAIAIYTLVAESESDWRDWTAIQASVLLPKTQGFAAQEAFLTQHPYLFDPQYIDNESIAIAYNNRCYARMEQGELKSALDDCNASLKFGNLPNAHSKKRRLEKMLSSQTPTR